VIRPSTSNERNASLGLRHPFRLGERFHPLRDQLLVVGGDFM